MQVNLTIGEVIAIRLRLEDAIGPAVAVDKSGDHAKSLYSALAKMRNMEDDIPTWVAEDDEG